MNEIVILQKPSMIVMGIECRTSNTQDAAPQDIPKLWGRFYQENIATQIPNKASKDVVALYCDYEKDFTRPYSCVIGCPVTSLETIPKGMVAKVVPASIYAVFRVAGEFPKCLIDTWGKIWTTDLKRTYTGDFELYKEGSESQSCLIGSNQDLNIYIAVSAQAIISA